MKVASGRRGLLGVSDAGWDVEAGSPAACCGVVHQKYSLEAPAFTALQAQASTGRRGEEKHELP